MKKDPQRLEELELIFRAANEAIFCLDKEYGFRLANQKTEELTGHVLSELKERTLPELLPPKYLEPTLEKLKRALEGEEVEPFEMEIFQKSGDTALLEVSVARVKLGKRKGILCVGREIAERRRSEEEVKYLREFGDRIIESIRQGIVVLNKRMKVIRFNSYMEEKYRWREDHLNQDIFKLIPALRDQELEKVFLSVIESNEPKEASGVKLSLKGLGTVFQNIKGYPLSKEGRLVGVVVVIEDVTEKAEMEEAVEKETARRELLYKVSKATSSSLDLDTLLKRISVWLKKSIAFDHGAVFLLDEEGRLLLRTLFKSRLARKAHADEIEIMKEKIASFGLRVGRGMTGWVAETGEPILSGDVSQDSRYLGVDEVKSELCVPLRLGDRVLGVIDLQSKQANAYTKEDVDLLSAVAGEASVAIENARLYQEQKRGVEDLSTLLETSRAVTSTLAPKSVLEIVGKKAKEVFRADSATIHLVDRKAKTLKPVVMFGDYADGGPAPSLQFEEGVPGWVASTGVGEIVNQAERDPRMKDLPSAPAGPQALLSVPIVSKEEVTGVITLGRRGEDSFGEEDLRLLTTLSGYASTAIETGRLFEESRKKLSQLSALYEASRVLTTSLDVAKILNAVVREAMKLMDTQTASIMLFNENDELVFRIAKGLSPGQIESYGQRPLTKSDGLARRMVEGKTPLLADALDQVPGLTETLLRKDTKSFYSFPLMAKGSVIGVLNVSSPRPHRITQDEIEVFTSLANQAAVALENAQLYARAATQMKEASAIRDMGLAIGSVLHPRELLARASSTIRDSVGYPYVAILLVDEKSSELYVESVQGYEGILDLRMKIGGESVPGRVVEEGKPLLLADVGKDSRYVKLSEAVKCEICVPLKKGDKVIGVLDVGSDEVGGLADNDLKLLEQLASQISGFLESARLYEEIRSSYREVDLLRGFSQSILQNIPSGIITINTKGAITMVNQAAERLLGCSKDELFGSYVEDLFGLPDGIPSPLLATLKDGEGHVREEVQIRTKGGKLVPVGFSTSLLMDEKGEVRGAIGILRDISRIKEMERRLTRADRLAALGEMVAGVAHEVKNPLAGIRTGVELLSKGLPPDSPQNENVDPILSEIDRLDRIVRDMSSFAYRPPLELSPVDAGELLNSSLKLLEKEIEEGGVAVKTEFHPQLPLIMGDRDQLTEVFYNLLLNACQAMREGGGEITVRTDHLPEEDVVEIKIEDTGSGIPREELPKIFNPFFTTKKRGTGLGLSIVHRIVEDHNGTISADSKSGEGSTFTLKLPRKGFDYERGA